MSALIRHEHCLSCDRRRELVPTRGSDMFACAHCGAPLGRSGEGQA
jgi:predicted RNA-binding Zn-ribbon protein involved in translation (DUF1610 family)